MRVLLASFKQETSSFNPHPTTRDLFSIHRGDEILEEYADTHKTSEDKTSGDPYASRTAALVDAFLEAENQEARCTLDFCSHSMPWAVRGTLRPWSKQDSDDPYGMRFSCGCRPQHACALRAVVWSRSLVLLM